jgi:hypothetical protein
MLRKLMLLSSIVCFVISTYIAYSFLFAQEPEPSEKTNQIHQAFFIVEEYINSKEEIPVRSEMNQWLKSYSGPNQYVIHVKLVRPTDTKHLPLLLGEIPSDSYLLAYWRSEWWEEYAPWSGRSTMCAIEKTCNSFSSLWWAFSVFLFLGLSFLWAARKCRNISI